MNFKIGDKIKVIVDDSIFKNCEGVIVDIDEDDYWIELYKGNEFIEGEMLILLLADSFELIPKLDIKRLREEKETKIISTEESLIDIIPFYDPEDFK